MAAEKKRKADTAAKVPETEPQFYKEQIVTSEKYHDQRDLVDALLEDGRKYTLETVEEMLEQYKKGKVK